MREGRVANRLPVAISADIGRICYAYSILEHRMRTLVYALLQLDSKAGRLAVREPRGKEMIDLIRDLTVLHGNSPNKKWWQKLRDDVELVSTERDKFAHGIWLREPKTRRLLLRVTRGKLPPELDQERTSRKIKPQGFPYSPAECGKLVAKIRELSEVILRLVKILDAARRASRKKSARQPPTSKGRPRRTQQALPAQPPTSRL